MLAPGAIIDAPERWTAIDSDHVRGVYATGNQSVQAARDYRIPTLGEGRWHAPPPEGPFTYVEFQVDDIAYTVRSGP